MSPRRTELLLVRDAEALAERACSQTLKLAGEAIAARGAFHVALSGGSTPRATYARLARAGWLTEFSRWHVWFGDERCVPPDHAHSNYRMARETLLDRAEIPAAQVHRMRGEASELREAADEYERELGWALGDPPRLDLVLLGLGHDGHTASLFPGSRALREPQRIVVANWVEHLGAHRLTLTPRALDAARCVLFLVSGADKAEALRAAWDECTDPELLPARLVQPSDGHVIWLADRAAAARMGPTVD